MNIAIENLFLIAKNLTLNSYSKNYRFILSQINNTELNIFETRKSEVEENNKKEPIHYDEALDKVLIMYDEIYDINLFIYKSTENETIINIKYFLKSSLDYEYQKTVKGNKPMLHSKIDLPMNYQENKKFDINWIFNENSNFC